MDFSKKKNSVRPNRNPNREYKPHVGQHAILGNSVHMWGADKTTST